MAADTVCAKPLRLVNDFFHMPALCVFFSLNFPPVRESTCCSIFRWCLCNGHLLIHRRTVADAEVLGIKEPLADQHSLLAGDPGGVEGDWVCMWNRPHCLRCLHIRPRTCDPLFAPRLLSCPPPARDAAAVPRGVGQGGGTSDDGGA